MKLLIKLGGTLLDAEQTRVALAGELQQLTAAGHAVVVVHGGGRQMTQFLSAQGIESEFVGGLRVSTPAVIDALLKVLAGSVNAQLVTTLVAAGSKAVGLSGLDAGLVLAEQMRPELAAVGLPVGCQAELLTLLTSAGYLPVVACVAGNGRGEVFNVNADAMAVACAAGFGADALLFLTDVDGVRGARGEVLPALTLDASERLIEAGVATGGMQAKLTAAGQALRAGVGEVWIAPGQAAHILQRWAAGEALGTRMHQEELS